jgi:transcription antitermination factor NusG
LIIGQSLNIDEGPFKGFPGTIVSIDGGIIELDIWLLGQKNTISFNVDNLSKPR